MQKKHWKRIGIVAAIILGWHFIIAALTWNAVRSLQLLDLQRAQRSSFWARQLLSPIDATLGWVSADIRTWSVSLQLLEHSAQLAQLSRDYIPNAFAGADSAKAQAQEVRQLVGTLTVDLETWLTTYSQSVVLPQLLGYRLRSTPLQSLLSDSARQMTRVNEVTAALDTLLQGKHRYIVLLQNSDELRPTGGFMGSYALVELDQGAVTTFEIQDIYVPDGQYQGFTQAPPGINEYLSSGKGLRLPDSNWNPDFPLATQEISSFFALGGVNDVEGVIALNLPVAEDLLRVLGPLHLPDYDQTVTAENLSILARLDRDEFFPGSQQKRQFLQSLLTQVKISTTDLTPQQLTTITEILRKAAHQKNIQGYSTNPAVQAVIARNSITGTLSTQRSPRYLFLVESNVGINKANRLVNREVLLNLQQNTTSLTLQFKNKNPETSVKAERGEYINYQRIFVPSNHRVHELVVNGEVLTSWDEQLITTSQNEQLKQIGFLVTVPAESDAECSVKFMHPELPLRPLTLQKQSGLAPTIYQVTTPSHTQTVLLEADTILSLDATIELEKE